MLPVQFVFLVRPWTVNKKNIQPVSNRLKKVDVEAYVTPIIIKNKRVAARPVRVHPEITDATRVEAVYRRINSGRPASFLNKPTPSLIQKVSLLAGQRFRSRW